MSIVVHIIADGGVGLNQIPRSVRRNIAFDVAPVQRTGPAPAAVGVGECRVAFGRPDWFAVCVVR